MIYDCFMFFNELDLLEIRLNTLNSYVDKFVIVEMDKTHSNKEKIFYFEENKNRFKQFIEKIIYIKITHYPIEYKNAWTYENYHRNMIHEGIKNCNNEDIIIISDLDEIPNPSIIIKYKNKVYGKDTICLNHHIYNYFLNYKDISNRIWQGSRIITFESYMNNKLTPQLLRDNKSLRLINKGGWHFSYLGGYENIILKIKSYAHQEYNNDEFLNENIKRKIDMGVDLFNQKCQFIPIKPNNKSLPEFIRNNYKQYNNLIYENINIFRNILIFITKKPYYIIKSVGLFLLNIFIKER